MGVRNAKKVNTCSTFSVGDKAEMKREGIGNYEHLSRLMTKPTKWHVRPVKTQISLGIRCLRCPHDESLDP